MSTPKRPTVVVEPPVRLDRLPGEPLWLYIPSLPAMGFGYVWAIRQTTHIINGSWLTPLAGQGALPADPVVLLA